MKKIRVTESELINLIEKLVKENFAQGATNGNGQNFGLFGTPTSKYKDLLEKEDIEETDEISEDETNIDTAQGADQTLNLNIMNKTNQEDWMEGIEESKLINRLKTRLNEQEGKGCAESEGGSGCIKKKGGKWVIMNNKKGGIFRECDSKKHCEEILDAFHASKG